MKSLIIIRPHAVLRGLVGNILQRFEQHGIQISGLKIHNITGEQAKRLYEAHEGQYFYDRLIRNMTNAPSVLAVLDIDVPDPEDAVMMVRRIIGNTDPAKAEMGTIRGDFGLRIDQNIIHASDSRKDARKEIPLFFNEDELVDYNSNE